MIDILDILRKCLPRMNWITTCGLGQPQKQYTQQTVYIGMDATDELSGLAVPSLTLVHQAVPGITLVPMLGSSLTNGTLVASYDWVVEIGEATLNGVYDVQTIVVDRSGNATTNEATIEVNKTEIEITVELEGAVPAAFYRDVLLVMTDTGGTMLESRLETLEFVNSAASLSMKQVPVGVAAISADTEWTLRTRQALVFDVDDQVMAYLVLKGGDLNNDNLVDMLDFARLRYFYNLTTPEADIDGDSHVNMTDYGLLQYNWYLTGDAE